jgi:hypothetical protein
MASGKASTIAKTARKVTNSATTSGNSKGRFSRASFSRARTCTIRCRSHYSCAKATPGLGEVANCNMDRDFSVRKPGGARMVGETLLAHEKELAHLRDQIAGAAALPWVRVACAVHPGKQRGHR